MIHVPNGVLFVWELVHPMMNKLYFFQSYIETTYFNGIYESSSLTNIFLLWEIVQEVHISLNLKDDIINNPLTLWFCPQIFRELRVSQFDKMCNI